VRLTKGAFRKTFERGLLIARARTAGSGVPSEESERVRITVRAGQE